jgi:hypothetical protein
MEEQQTAVDLAQVEAGMDLCSSDFRKWGEITEVRQGGAGGPALVIGTADTSGLRVYVPEDALLEIHGRCLRLTRPLAELDGAGFDRKPAGLSE